MEVREVAKHVNKQPFIPFRLHLSDQTNYEVRHPEMVFLWRYNVILALETDEYGIAIKGMDIAPEHIVRIEPMEPSEAR